MMMMMIFVQATVANHTLCIQYLSSLVRSIHSRTVASFLNLHFIREELYNWSDEAQKPLYGDICLAGFLKTLFVIAK